MSNPNNPDPINKDIPEKFNLGKPVATCGICTGYIYQHDMICALNEMEVAHKLCWDMKEADDETI